MGNDYTRKMQQEAYLRNLEAMGISPIPYLKSCKQQILSRKFSGNYSYRPIVVREHHYLSESKQNSSNNSDSAVGLASLALATAVFGPITLGVVALSLACSEGTD